MKFLKYLFFLILGFILIFFAFGIFKPSVSYGHEVTVNKPLKESWAVFQDHTKYGQWLQGFQSIDLISGKHNEVGSKYKVVVDPGQDQPLFEMIETLESKQDFDHVTLSFDSDMMQFDQTTTHSFADGKTTIKTDSKVTGKGIVMKSMFAIMSTFGNSFQVQEEKNIEALKTVIENNTTDYYPVVVDSLSLEDGK